jgi:DNA-binding transcriptional regulator of glucitol operon
MMLKGGDRIMKAFVSACIATVVIAIAGAIVLGGMQDSADRAFSSSAVRLGP